MKSRFLIAIIFWSSSAFAHQDKIYSVNKGNVHLQYLSGWGGLEIDNKIKIFIEICDKLVKGKFGNSDQLYIYFGHDYTKRDNSHYALGYGQFSFWDYEKYKSSIDITAGGIKVFIRDKDFDIKRMLLLVNSAFSNIDFLKRNQSKYHIESIHYNADTVYSIPFQQIEKYLSSSDSTVNSLLTKKYYRDLTREEDGRIGYYFQNNQFHFYNTGVKKWSSEKGDYVVTNTSDEDILVVENIYEIFGNVTNGYFVFTNDSSFYFITRFNNKIRGPFKIDSVRAGRPPISEYYHENNPFEKFILFIDNYGSYDKALFLPDSNILISNYHIYENNLINDLFKKNTAQIEDKRAKNLSPSLLILLGLSIVLNIWLILRHRK